MLGKFLRGKMPNQPLARAIFTTSLAASRASLMQDIWNPEINDTVNLAALWRGDSLDYIKLILTNGTVAHHKRFNTVEKLCALLLDPDSPALVDAMTLEKSELEKRSNVCTTNIPQTDEEHQMEQLEKAELYLKQHHSFSASTLMEEVEDEDEEDDEEEENGDGEEPANSTASLPWIPSIVFDASPNYTWARTVYYRTNVAISLMRYIRKNYILMARDKFFEPKVLLFINRHLKVVQYLDSLPNPTDDAIDVDHLCSLYEPLGPSKSDDDKDYFTVTRKRVKIKDTPVEHLKARFPALLWDVEQVAESIRTGGILRPSRYIKTECVEWAPLNPETISESTHTLYLACIYLLNQCHNGILSETTTSKDRDALWAYYCAFTDIFYACLPGGNMSDSFLLTPYGSTVRRDGGIEFSDELSPWEMYGTNMSIRAFHCGDLPDFFNVLGSLPLWGEQDTPTYRIGKIYQKSLPFACQRRHIIKLIVRTATEDESFWSVFSKLFWCMLAGLYPDDLGAAHPNGNLLMLRDLLRIRELTSSKMMLLSAISADTPSGTPGANGGPLVVFIAFRLHILYMASLNPTYKMDAEKCIDWEYFHQNTVELANIIRGTSLFPDDPFAQARKQLSKTVKSPHSRVHRFRRKSKAEILKDYTNEALEKTIICDKHNRIADLALLKRLRSQYSDLDMRLAQFRQSMIGIDFVSRINPDVVEVTLENMDELIDRRIAINENAIALYDDVLNFKCKSAILNLLARIPPHERLTQEAFSILTLPEHGGISQLSVQNMCTLSEIYFNNAVPMNFRQCIASMNPPHLVIICFYFNMVALLEKIDFVTLDARTVERINHAMLTSRYHMYPGQTLPDDVYNVSIALCCSKICNLMGQGKYGDKKVAYDLEKMSFVCAHGKSMHAHNKLDEEEEEEDDSKDSLDEDDDEDESGDDKGNDNYEDVNLTLRVLEAQDDKLDDFMAELGAGTDLIAEASKKKGRGTRRSKKMEDRKMIRNERKLFNRVPCGQPVLTISLRGRALIWGSTLENRSQIMHCPQCGALHIYTILNFSGSPTGLYRCNECARKETSHLQYRRCAYCDKAGPFVVPEKYNLYVLCPEAPVDPLVDAEDSYQRLYFCRAHYSIAKRFAGDRPKAELWERIKTIEHLRLMEHTKKVSK